MNTNSNFAAYSNFDHSGKSFYRINFSNQTFIGCIFDGCDFSETILSNTTFDNCSMKNCKFNNAILANTTFRNSDLTDSTYSEKISMSRPPIQICGFGTKVIIFDYYIKIGFEEHTISDCKSIPNVFTNLEISSIWNKYKDKILALVP